jgi:hypothetical protein
MRASATNITQPASDNPICVQNSFRVILRRRGEALLTLALFAGALFAVALFTATLLWGEGEESNRRDA